MKRLLVLLLIVLVAVLLGLILSRTFRPPRTAPELALSFTRAGVMVVRNTSHAKTVEVYDDANRLVARTQAFGRPALEVRFAWQPGAWYRVVPDDGPGTTARAPQAIPDFLVRLHAPIGQRTQEYAFTRPYAESAQREIAVPAAPGETIEIMLEVEKLTDGDPIPLQLTSEIPLKLLIGAEREGLHLEFDKKVWWGKVTLGEHLPEEPQRITLETGRFVLPLGLRFVSRELDEGGLSVVDWRLPTEADGLYERQRVEDRISMPSRMWVRVASWFGIRSELPIAYEPFVHQTLWIRNHTAQPISLLLAAEVLDPRTRQPVDYFVAPEFESVGGTRRILAYSHIGPGQTQPCVLPVYVQPETPAGTYLRRVGIGLLGSDTLLLVQERPLGVVRANLVFAGWVLGVAVLSLTWLLATLLLYRRIVRSLGTRVLVLLTLLGSLQFCLQLVGTLVSMVFSAVLGPFNCLVGGLLTEVLTYLAITSILFLVPRVGAMTLAGLVAYVMGGVLFGSFGLADLLVMGSAIAFKELFLFCFGVTRFGPVRPTPPKLLTMMLALGLADAASAFTSLALQAVFYRLFFAGWYIVLQVGVTGFLYTALGVYLGKSLGMSLRKVHQ